MHDDDGFASVLTCETIPRSKNDNDQSQSEQGREPRSGGVVKAE
jgi:hypothetical protein